MNYLNVCAHSRSQDIVGFGHALVFVIALAVLAVAALPCLGLPTTYSRISLASLPQSPVLVSLTHSLAHSLSLSTHISSNLLTHTYTHSGLLSHALFVHSSSFRSLVRSFAEPNIDDDEEVLSHCCRPLPIHSPRPRLASCAAACCVCVGVGVAVCVALLYFVRACVRAVAVAVSVAVCVLVLVLVCRHGALCFVGWTTTTTTATTTERQPQPQPQQSQRRRARRSTPRSSRVLPPLPLAPHISL